MAVSERPCSSSPLRMAATRPSIMSLGATTSAPDCAYATAARVRSGVLDGPEGGAHRAVRIPGAGPLCVLVVGNAEEDHRAHAGGARGLGLLDDQVDRELRDAGHGPDRLAHSPAADGEQRKDEVRRLDARLAHQGAERRGAAQAAGAVRGETHYTNRNAAEPCCATSGEPDDHIL